LGVYQLPARSSVTLLKASPIEPKGEELVEIWKKRKIIDEHRATKIL
jgi:hypothetical protein